MFARALLGGAALALAVHVAPASAQQANEITVLRQQMQALQSHLDALEAAQRAPAPAAGPAAGPNASNAFNPGIGLVLDGRAGYSKLDPDTYTIAGVPFAGEAPGIRGLALGEAELNVFANVDDMFFGNLTLAAEEDGGDTELALRKPMCRRWRCRPACR